jgi:hypothetical protein
MPLQTSKLEWNPTRWAVKPELGALIVVATAVVALLTGAQPAAAQLTVERAQSFVPGPCCLMPAATELYFGRTVARGDFNEDGFDDLVIAAPGATVDGEEAAGRVAILPGTAAGPTLAGQIAYDELVLGGEPGTEDLFGAALATGDWNGDGADDLAIGVPGDDTDDGGSAGSLFVLYGNDAQGGMPGPLFGGEADQFFLHISLGGFPHPNDRFGSSLATGDFDGDGTDDLAVGISGDNVQAGYFYAGSVSILLGGEFGLSPAGGNNFSRLSLSWPDTLQDSEEFGYALAAGDFDGDGIDELAVGAPGRNGDSELWVGEVVVLAFEPDGAGIDVADHWVWQEGEGIPGAEEPSDGWGRALAAGDFRGDGADDLVIGASWESVGSDDFAGAIAVLQGTPGVGLAANASLYTQDDLSGQMAREDELFGAAFAVGDFDGNGVEDLAIGTPGDSRLVAQPMGGFEWVPVGAIHVLPGSPGGLAFAAIRTFDGAPGVTEAPTGFGAALAAGRFRGTVSDSLAVGATLWDAFGHFNVGRAAVLHSIEIFRDGFESGSTSAWAPVP